MSTPDELDTLAEFDRWNPRPGVMVWEHTRAPPHIRQNFMSWVLDQEDLGRLRWDRWGYVLTPVGCRLLAGDASEYDVAFTSHTREHNRVGPCGGGAAGNPHPPTHCGMPPTRRRARILGTSRP